MPSGGGEVDRVAADARDGSVGDGDRRVHALHAVRGADVLALVAGAGRAERHVIVARLAVVVVPRIGEILLVALRAGAVRCRRDPRPASSRTPGPSRWGSECPARRPSCRRDPCRSRSRAGREDRTRKDRRRATCAVPSDASDERAGDERRGAKSAHRPDPPT